MLINSVILVLREVLEAALLVSVLLAMSSRLRISLQWLLFSLPVTAVSVWLFSSFLDAMTDALYGAGQEVTSAVLQSAVFACIVVVVYSSGRGRRGYFASGSTLAASMALAVVCALMREGSEILIYIAGFAASVEHRTAVFAGGAIGAGIGISVGVLLYAGLCALPWRHFMAASRAILGLIGAGMIMQSTLLLEQVDWLPAGSALWDSNGLIDEQSLTGQLLYAVFGYEATPGLYQATLYIVSIVLLVAACLLSPALKENAIGAERYET